MGAFISHQTQQPFFQRRGTVAIFPMSERVVNNNDQLEEIGPASIHVTLALIPVDAAVAVRALEQ